MATEEYTSEKQEQSYQELWYVYDVYQKMEKEYRKILDYRAEVMNAHVDGKPIEYFNKKSLKWKTIKNPLFNWEKTDYRIKEVDIPKPPPVQEVDPLSEFVTELTAICISFAEKLHKKLDK